MQYRVRTCKGSILTIDDGFPDVRLTPIDLLMREYRSISRKSYGKNFLKYRNAKGSEHLAKINIKLPQPYKGHWRIA